MGDVLLVVAQTALLVALAPLWVGLVAAMKARLQMRRGAPVWQRWRDIAKLAEKETVVSEDASPLARVAPYVVLAASFTVCAWTPVLSTSDGLGFAGDLIMTVALFAAVRVLLALLALDEPHRGERQEVRGREPLRISAAVAAAPAQWLSPSHLLALTAMWLVVLSETGRVPVGDPVTHVELTMVHEGLVLDVSGRHLALLEWAAHARTLVLLTLVANLFLPWGIATDGSPPALAFALAAWLVKLVVFAGVVAITESVTARMRLFRVPEFLGMAFLLALLALSTDSLLRG